MDTVYIPGTPGGAWTKEEVESTRRRVMKMITPIWKEKMDMGIWNPWEKTTTDENKLIRLAFHDCIPYEDGTGGCDGCLNWEGMYDPVPNVFKKDRVVENLEKIYKNIDWPYINP